MRFFIYFNGVNCSQPRIHIYQKERSSIIRFINFPGFFVLSLGLFLRGDDFIHNNTSSSVNRMSMHPIITGRPFFTMIKTIPIVIASTHRIINAHFFNISSFFLFSIIRVEMRKMISKERKITTDFILSSYFLRISSRIQRPAARQTDSTQKDSYI